MTTARKKFAGDDSGSGRLDGPLALQEQLPRGGKKIASGPTPIHSVSELEDALSLPSEATIASLARIDGDLLILGVGGKMGPSLARMARRAFDEMGVTRRVIGVSRFSADGLHDKLRDDGVHTIAGDLLDAEFVNSLPDVENVIYLVGVKFGTAGEAAHTWASNAYLPGLVMNRFRKSRVVALSSGNVYGLTPVDKGRGSAESDVLKPQGEYAMSVLGRERVLEHFCRANGTRTTLIRLNYATELRYGVLVDLAKKVLQNEPVSLSMGYFNAIWQRDACNRILSSLEHASVPPLVLNVTGIERLSCRKVCERFGELFNRKVKFADVESDTALLSDATLAASILGPPELTFEDMAVLTAEWMARGGETWDKPTQFEVRDGKY